jgi:hypothetical protein
VVAESAKRLTNSIMKVKILAQAADGLWGASETRARQLFLLAFQTIDQVKLDAKQDQRAMFAESTGGTSGLLFELRSSLLQLIARRDHRLAESLRKSSGKESPNDADRKNTQSPAEQVALYLDNAVALAKTQPAQSSQMIETVLRDGINASLISALLRMRKENPPLADQLFREALTIAGGHELMPNELESLALYVLPTEEEAFFGNNSANDLTRVTIIRQFLDYVYGVSRQFVIANNLSSNDGNGIDRERAESEYSTLKSLLPLFERWQPDRADFIREQMRSLLGYMKPEDANAAESTRQQSVDDLIRMAESTIGDRRRTIAFIRASTAALNQGDVDKAVELAGRIDDSYERKIQTSLILYQAAMKRLRDANLPEAYRYAKRIEFLPQRVAVFHRMAQKLWTDKEPDQARELIEDLWAWLIKADNSPAKVDAMLKITVTMAEHDPGRAFEWLESVVEALNGTDFTFKPAEPGRLSVEVHIALDMLDLEAGFGKLARYDYERALLIAQGITKAEASLFAEAIVCRQVLNSH